MLWISVRVYKCVCLYDNSCLNNSYVSWKCADSLVALSNTVKIISFSNNRSEPRRPTSQTNIQLYTPNTPAFLPSSVVQFANKVKCHWKTLIRDSRMHKGEERERQRETVENRERERQCDRDKWLLCTMIDKPRNSQAAPHISSYAWLWWQNNLSATPPSFSICIFGLQFRLEYWISYYTGGRIWV